MALQTDASNLLIQASSSNTELSAKELAYILGHDFREPLRMANGYSQLIQRKLKDQADKDILDYLHFLTDGVKRMDLMVQFMSTFLRLQRNPEEENSILLSDIIECISLGPLQELFTATKGEITYPENIMLFGNYDHLKTIFEELIKNALIFQPKGQVPVINLEVTKIGSVYQFLLQDNGHGFPSDPSVQKKLFSIFQKNPFAEVSHNGLGIGLPLVRRILQLYHSDIEVQAIKDWSTSLKFSLPTG